MSIGRRDIASDDGMPVGSQADQPMIPQQPRLASGAIRRTRTQTAEGTKRAIWRLLAKFDAIRGEADGILRKLQEISRQLAQQAGGNPQDRSA